MRSSNYESALQGITDGLSVLRELPAQYAELQKKYKQLEKSNARYACVCVCVCTCLCAAV